MQRADLAVKTQALAHHVVFDGLRAIGVMIAEKGADMIREDAG